MLEEGRRPGPGSVGRTTTVAKEEFDDDDVDKEWPGEGAVVAEFPRRQGLHRKRGEPVHAAADG